MSNQQNKKPKPFSLDSMKEQIDAPVNSNSNPSKPFSINSAQAQPVSVQNFNSSSSQKPQKSCLSSIIAIMAVIFSATLLCGGLVVVFEIAPNIPLEHFGIFFVRKSESYYTATLLGGILILVGVAGLLAGIAGLIGSLIQYFRQ